MEKLQEDCYLQKEVGTYKWTATILADTIFLKKQALSGTFTSAEENDLFINVHRVKKRMQ